MTPAQLLTPEQQEQNQQAHRQNAKLERMWQMFVTLMATDGNANPAEILVRTETAVDVWMRYDDANRISMMDIADPSSSYLSMLMDQMKKAGDKADRRGELLEKLAGLNGAES